MSPNRPCPASDRQRPLPFGFRFRRRPLWRGTGGALLALLMACSGGQGDGTKGSGSKFRIKGTVGAPLSAARLGQGWSAASGRTVTHVMAVNPESARPDRIVAPVNADGSFSLSVPPGRPYVLVFVDNTAVGVEMVVSIFKAGTLDTVAPRVAGGQVDLGEVDTAQEAAQVAITYDDLLESLGLSPAAANFLGAIDDLSLRYANPDVDGDGIMDVEQDREMLLDFHIRGLMRKGSASGPPLRVSDMTDGFFAHEGSQVATPAFNLASIYALYKATFDGTAYVNHAHQLQNGADFTAVHADGSPVGAPSSFSPLQFGDVRGWGPDYAWHDAGTTLELPGSGGSPATLQYILGATDRTLTFSNVITRTRASLTDVGTLVPFLSFTTTDGLMTSLEYKWMKRSSAEGWVEATEEEIQLLVNDDGGYAAFYRGAKENSIAFRIPRKPSGSIPWTAAGVNHTTVDTADLMATTPNDICSMAVSYDDKLGLRLFIGGAEPNVGVTPCY